jgi:FlaA1/EpsC-like NDP-sugar epimerase
VKEQTVKSLDNLRKFLISLSRPVKTSILLSFDFAGFVFFALFAFWLVSGQAMPTPETALIALLTAVVSLFIAWQKGLYKALVRYMGFELMMAGAITAFGGALAGGLICLLIGPEELVFRWAAVYAAMAILMISGGRYMARAFLITRPSDSGAELVVIYGAGEAGAQLAISLQEVGETIPVAMVDDDESLHGKRVKGLSVYPPAQIDQLMERTGASRVLLAIPRASRRRRRKVLERLSEHPFRVQTMPDFQDIVSGQARVDDIRDVDVQDLLGRNAVPPNPRLLDASIKGKNVLVTGAGGSIGAELCRQILHLKPASLVLFELSEPALYNIDQELRKVAAPLRDAPEIIALLGSVHHEERIKDVMATFNIQTVFHAAAYKHVPIVEHNLFEGIHNNVFGTLHAARAAIDANVETFVLISTDKAVNPTSVMGASKRFAEMILQAYQRETREIRLCMVRFGNVLESSGSVVPLFKEQIRNGGPVTVTHRDIIRYFMTIPEAAQLVIQAGAMAKGGDVFVLDMGKPVRIYDLACRMIKLMGCTVRDESNPDGDIEIEFTGLRPAEKLFEELLIGSNVSGTEHRRILRADEDFLDIHELNNCIAELQAASQSLDHGRARQILLEVVREYSPTNGIDDLVWLKKTGTEADPKATSDRIVDFPKKPT